MTFRVMLTGIALALVLGASASSRDELRTLYGEPIGEVYRAGGDVILTTSRDAHRNICLLRIEHETRGRRLTDAELNTVLDKVAPKADRGDYVIGTFLNILCPPDSDCSGASEDYKRLAITKIGNTNEYRYVVIFYHRPECEAAKPHPTGVNVHR
jgi:hypothetical protein